MEKENEGKVIDLEGKDKQEIYETYLKIADDTYIQNEIYEKVQDKEAATKLYKLYKMQKENKGDQK